MKMLPEITRVDDKETSVQSVGGARAIQVLSRGNVFTKTWNWSPISEKTAAMQ